MSDAGAVMQRAQDRIAEMQARAGAIDELIASGSLTDLSSGRDDIQAQLDQVASKGQVEAELASLKSELAAANPVAALDAADQDPATPEPGKT
jgi:phage shock protein A